LAVIDAAKVDGRRHLILIRRDNVEHLLLIGGPTDIVVEPNVVRAAAREPALPQATQHPATQHEVTPNLFTPPHPRRQPPPAEEPVSRHAKAEPRPSRQPRSADRLAALAAGISDQPAWETALRTPHEHEVSREPHTPDAVPQNSRAEEVFTSAAGHNSDEMAQRLIEAGLLRRQRPPPKTQSKPQAEAPVEREPLLSAPVRLNGSAGR
jgi:hypothetical protein